MEKLLYEASYPSDEPSDVAPATHLQPTFRAGPSRGGLWTHAHMMQDAGAACRAEDGPLHLT